jgi:hypothetical protein
VGGSIQYIDGVLKGFVDHWGFKHRHPVRFQLTICQRYSIPAVLDRIIKPRVHPSRRCSYW